MYGTPASTYVRSVRLLLEEISIGLYLDATLADRKFSFSDPMLQARMPQIIGKLGRNPVLLARIYKSCWYQQKFRCKIDSVAKLNVCT